MYNNYVETNPFHVMVKPAGAACNMACRYCFYLNKKNIYPKSDFKMNEKVLELFIRQYIEAQPEQTVTFAWQGGEPTLMGIEFFQKAVQLQNKYVSVDENIKTKQKNINNIIQTNGILLNDEWCSFFKKNNFLIGLSLDGPEEIHNSYRKDIEGNGTFKKVMEAVQLLKKHNVEFNILTSVHAENENQPRRVYRFLRDTAEARHIQFIPIVETDIGNADQVKRFSVTAKGYGRFLSKVFNEWVRRDVGSVFIQLFDVALAAWLGYNPGLCSFSEVCGNMLALEHTGDVYSCDHYVDSNHFLGNIAETHLGHLVSSPKQLQFGNLKRERLPQNCLECPVRFVCNGGCPKNRILKTSDGSPGRNFLCAGYKQFFNHIERAMNIMSEEWRAGRSPARVMSLL